MDLVADNLRRVVATLEPGVTLTAVSKFHPVEALREAYDAGQRVFGESRVQELLEKIPQMPGDVKWHFIGHLQTNKVRQIVGRVDLVESVDSGRLLRLIDSESCRAGVRTRVLLQVHVAREETKFGFFPEELLEIARGGGFRNLEAVDLCGVMGMASNTDDLGRIEEDFRAIRGIFEQIRSLGEEWLGEFRIVSMGMSGDYLTAMREGSTMVRIGTDIFGEREY